MGDEAATKDHRDLVTTRVREGSPATVVEAASVTASPQWQAWHDPCVSGIAAVAALGEATARSRSEHKPVPQPPTRWASFGAEFGVRIWATWANIAWLSLIWSEFPIAGVAQIATLNFSGGK